MIDCRTPEQIRDQKLTLAFIRAITSKYSIGKQIKKADGSTGIVHINTIEKFKLAKNGAINPFTTKKYYLKALSNSDFMEHWTGLETYFFTASDNINGKGGLQTLVMIDIDCHHGYGSAAGALALAQHLKNTLFPGLFWEPSRNKIGIHCFFVVDLPALNGLKARTEFNQHLKNLEHYLDNIAAGFDVQMVEIKGTATRLQYAGEYSATQHNELVNVHCGSFGKFPREWATRGAELRNTTHHPYRWLREIPRTAARDRSKPLPVALEVIVEAPAAPEPTIDKPTIKLAETSRKGSIAGSVVNDDIKSKLQNWKDMVSKWLQNKPIKTTGKHVATIDDAAIFLMLLYAYHEKPNEDGSLPRARFEFDWNKMFDAGEIDRAWQVKRYTAIRQWFIRAGLIKVADRPYVIGENGIAGKAMQWKMSDELYAAIENGTEIDVEYMNDKVSCESPLGEIDVSVYQDAGLDLILDLDISDRGEYMNDKVSCESPVEQYAKYGIYPPVISLKIIPFVNKKVTKFNPYSGLKTLGA